MSRLTSRSAVPTVTPFGVGVQRRTHMLPAQVPLTSPANIIRSSIRIHDNERHTFGICTPLPASVQDVLRANPDFDSYSGYVEKSGYALLVVKLSSNFTLHVWKFRSSKPELYTFSLPASSATPKLSFNLICLVLSSPTASEYTTSLLACTPEGALRFWSTLANSDKMIDGRLSLQNGEQCTHAVALSMNHFGIATTFGRLFVVTIYLHYETMTSIVLAPKLGWVSGFGKIFGFSGSQADKATRALLVGDDNSGVLKYGISEQKLLRDVFIMSEERLKCWTITTENYQEIFDIPIREIISRSLQERNQETQGIQTMRLLDMKISNNNLYILAVTAFYTAEIKYSIHQINISEQKQQPQYLGFEELKFALPFDPKRKDLLTDVSLLVIGSSAYVVVGSNMVIFTSVPTDDQPLDYVELNPSTYGSFIGFGESDDSVIFISTKSGILEAKQITRLQFSTATPGEVTSIQQFTPTLLQRTTPTTTGPPTISKSTPYVPTTLTQIGSARPPVTRLTAREIDDHLKRAHGIYCRQNEMNQQVADLINIILAGGEPADISKSIVMVSEGIVNMQIGRNTGAIGSESRKNDEYLSLSYQLVYKMFQDKQLIHSAFADMVTKSKLLNCLSSGQRARLLSHEEKLQSMIALQKVLEGIDSNEAYKLVNEAILKVLDMRNVPASQWVESGTAPRDHFFTKVTGIDQIFSALFSVEQQYLTSRQIDFIASSQSGIPGSFDEKLVCIRLVNQIFDSILFGSKTVRDKRSGSYFPPEETHPPLATWFSVNDVREAVFSQCIETQKILEEIKQLSSTEKTRQITTELLDQLHSLYDMALSSDVVQQQHLAQDRSRTQEYNALLQSHHQRVRMAVDVFTQAGLFSVAINLAEKYLDFVALISLCESNGDEERLRKYMDTYADKGFVKELFNWYYDNQYPAKLFSPPEIYVRDLAEFLANKTTVSWIQDLQLGNYDQACKTLWHLGVSKEERGEFTMEKENESQNANILSSFGSLANDIDGKQTILSLAKLSLLTAEKFSSESQERTKLRGELDQRLAVIDVQKGILPQIWDNFDSKTFRKPLTAEEIIHKILGSPGISIPVVILAFEVFSNSTSLRDDESNKKLLKYIWSTCLKLNNWEELQRESITLQEPSEKLHNTSLYQVILAPCGNYIFQSVPEIFEEIVRELFHAEHVVQFVLNTAATAYSAFEDLNKSDDMVVQQGNTAEEDIRNVVTAQTMEVHTS